MAGAEPVIHRDIWSEFPDRITMRDLFQGWRRKVGCVALVMACIITGLWVRTLFFADQLQCVIGGRTNYLISFRSGFCWMSVDGDASMMWTTITTEKLQSMYDQQTIPQISSSFVAQHSASGLHPGCCYLLYWWLALPLTLVAAYLILWKPQPKEPPHA